MTESSAFLALLGAAVLSLALVPPLRRLAWKVGLVDRPHTAAHKSHIVPTPYGGGVAIWMSTVGAALVVSWQMAPSRSAPGAANPMTCLLACATLIMVTGLVDDRFALPAWPRLLIQTGSVGALLWLSPEFLLPLGIPVGLQAGFTLLWMLALTNAFNFLDNMDGLAAGIAAGVCLPLAVIAWVAHAHTILVVDLALLGALAGFLVYNLPPASVFMGDAGGMFVGFLTSGMAALLSRRTTVHNVDGWLWLAPLLIFSIPLYDLFSVTLIRLRRGAPPWKGDNNHISHRLVARGLSRSRAVQVIHLGTVLLSLPALLLLYRDDGAFTRMLLFLYAAGLALLGGMDKRQHRGTAGAP